MIDVHREYAQTEPEQTTVPELHEVESEQEFATHIMLYGYSQSDANQLSEQQKRWLLRWG
jgi:hypothetical protein